MEQQRRETEEYISLRQEVREKTIGYILTALGLVAGLAWNDVARSFIEYLFPLPQNTLSAKFIYAAVISLVVIAVSVYLMRLLRHIGGGGTQK